MTYDHSTAILRTSSVNVLGTDHAALSPTIAPRFSVDDLHTPFGIVKMEKFRRCRSTDVAWHAIYGVAAAIALGIIANSQLNCTHSQSSRDILLTVAALLLNIASIFLFIYFYHKARVLVTVEKEPWNRVDAPYRALRGTYLTLFASGFDIASLVATLASLYFSIIDFNNSCPNRKIYTVVLIVTAVFGFAASYFFIWRTAWRVAHNLEMVYSFRRSHSTYTPMSKLKTHVSVETVHIANGGASITRARNKLM